jgi:gliding motility-associated-like protein
MLKLVFSITIILISARYSLAQTPSWQWAKNASSTGSELAWDVAYDSFSGNNYLCGYFNGNLSSTYGPSFSSSYGAKDGFVAKYDANGTFLWAFKIGGTNDEEVKSIITDPSGDVYITGYFKSVCDFDPSGATFNLTPNGGAGNQDGFLAKYNSAGNFLWAVKFGDIGAEDAWRLYADINGIYLTGSYNNSATFYSTNATTKTTASANNQEEFYGAKYNSAGVVQWVVSAGGNKEDVGFDVIADASNVYFVGQYGQPVDLFNASGSFITTLADQGGNKPNAFIFTVTQAGAYVWSNNVVSTDNDFGYGIAQDATGIYITGSIKATADFKYPGPTFTKAVVGGTDLYIAKLAKSTGNFLWVSSQTGSGGGDEVGYALKIDGNNNLIVTGNFKNTLNYSTYGGPNLITSGNEDVFVAAFDPANGNFLWVQQCLGSGKDVSYGLAVNASGAIYLAGEYEHALTIGTYTLPTNSSNNIFIAKTGCDIATNNTVAVSQTICAGNTPIGLTGSVPLGGNTYFWQTSANTLTWTNASGTYTNQNYNPPSLTSTTYYRRDLTAGGTCTNVSSSSIITITVNQPPTIANAGITQTVCAATATLAATNPTVGSGVWSVTTGTGSVTSISNPSSQVTALSTGTNSFLWTVSNGVCPTSTSAVTVIRSAMPSSFAGITQSVCAVTATLAATNPTVGSGVWSVITGTGNVTSVSNPSSQVTALSPGTNSFLWTVSNAVCPTATSVVTIIRDIIPTSFAGITQTVCAATATLAATNPTVGSGAWSVTTGTGSVTSISNPSSQVTALSTGTNSFLWTVSNGVCPTSTSAVTVIRNAMPTSFAGITQSVCAVTATLAATNPTVGSGAWSVITGTGNVTSVSNPSSQVTALSPGANAFLWTVSNGVCASATSTVIVIRDAFPDISNAGSNFTVCSSTTTLNANNPAVGIGSWSIISGSATIASPSNNQSVISNLNSGINEFIWTISNGTCPPSTSTISVFAETPLAPANAGTDQQICSTVCTLNANNSLGYGSWSIVAGTATVSNGSNPNTTVIGLSGGANVFIWTVSKLNCPITTDTVFIQRDENPTISDAGADQLICGPTITVIANAPLVGTGEWQVLSGTGNITNTNSPQTTILNLSAGTNTFIWEIKNGVCPHSTDTVIITSDVNPSDANLGADKLVCANTTTLTAVTPLFGIGTWTLLSGNAVYTNITANSINLSLPTPGTSTLRWTIKNGVCPDKFDDIDVTRFDPPSVADAGADQTIEKSVAKLNAASPVIGSGKWTVVEGSGYFDNASEANTTVNKLAIGTNILRWTTYNGNCLENTDDIVIYVKPLLIPNGFSPNGDGFNDKFIITSLEYYNNVKFSVFNRWGALLYSNTDYKNDWAGTNSNNEKLADDTYYYLLEIPELKGITGFIVVKKNK